MKRRSFLKALGLAPVAAPIAAQQAANETMNTMRGLGLSGVETNTYADEGLAISEPTRDWGQELANFLGKSKAMIEAERREHYFDGLDPQVAGLRSVALHHKIEMSRSRSYDRSQHRREHRLRQRIAGFFSD